MSRPPRQVSDRVAPDEFVFHLHRGVELLDDGRSLEAKESLERALDHRPDDPESQALLALVYFRLGLYPRAIELYQKLADDHPDTLSLRLNLAVCYLKTGQHALAEQVLVSVVAADPNHTKAWAYLGLAHERLGEIGKAARAYELGGYPKQADRVRSRAEGREDTARSPEVRDVASAFFDELSEERVEFRVAEGSQESAAGNWTTLEPGRRASGQSEAPAPAHAEEAPPSVAPRSLAPRSLAPRSLTPPRLSVPVPSWQPAGTDWSGRAITGPRPLASAAGPSTAPQAATAEWVVSPVQVDASGIVHVGLRAREVAFVRREALMGFDESLEPTPLVREQARGLQEHWCKMQGAGQLLLLPRGRRQAAELLGPLSVRLDVVLVHGELASPEASLRWKDGVAIRMGRFQRDTVLVVDTTDPILRVPLNATALFVRRELFVAHEDEVTLEAIDEGPLAQRGLLRVSGRGHIFLQRP